MESEERQRSIVECIHRKKILKIPLLMCSLRNKEGFKITQKKMLSKQKTQRRREGLLI